MDKLSEQRAALLSFYIAYIAEGERILARTEKYGLTMTEEQKQGVILAMNMIRAKKESLERALR